jgi:hypothetical protein
MTQNKTPMPLKDLLDLLDKLESRVNTYWNFYSVAVFATVGWLVSKDECFSRTAASAIAAGLVAFFAANLSVIHHAEARILAIESEIQQKDWSSIIVSGLFLHRLKTISIPKRSLFSKLFHIVIDAAVLLLLYTKVG